jgi:hypothetical protein
MSPKIPAITPREALAANRKTVSRILDQAGLTDDEFIALLRKERKCV